MEGLDWVSALRSKQVRKLAEGPLQPSLFDETDLAEIQHPEFPGERLIACKNLAFPDDAVLHRPQTSGAEPGSTTCARAASGLHPRCRGSAKSLYEA